MIALGFSLLLHITIYSPPILPLHVAGFGNRYIFHYNIFLLAPAVIIAASSSYISTVGSSITLTCNIVDKGAPQTSFSLRRNGNEINDESRLSINDTAMSLTLTNITMDNGGIYFCTGTGVISHRRDTVELIVEGIVCTQIRQQYHLVNCNCKRKPNFVACYYNKKSSNTYSESILFYSHFTVSRAEGLQQYVLHPITYVT